MADKKKMMAKFAEQQNVIEDRRHTSDKLVNNALLGCHNSNNKSLKSSASSIIITAGSSTTPARSRGVLMPTLTSVLCDTSGSARNGSPDDHFKEEGRNETEEKGLGTKEYCNCTVDIH